MRDLVKLFIFFAFCFSHDLQAQDGAKQVYEEYKQKVSAAQTISPLGDGLFGDKVNGYSGALQFSVVDVDLPGIGPPVRLQRMLDLDEVFRRPSRPREAGPGPQTGGQFWDWWLDVPHLYGSFLRTRGWESSGADPSLRCNQAALETAAPRPDSGGETANFWGGNFLHLPEQGDLELLHASATQAVHPEDGLVYRWVTDNQWAFSCLPGTSNGVLGDAFLARSPDGTRYWFDHFVVRTAGRSALNTGRDKVMILPTRIEDRFGNYVIYSYNPSYPMELSSIEAKDGRKISITYKRPYNGLISKIHEVSDGSRVWRYEYLNDPDGVIFDTPLKAVVLPDDSRWVYSYWAPEGGVQSNTPCTIGGFLHAANWSFSAKHPSGAVGNFSLKYRWNGRVGSPRICHQIDPTTFLSRSPSFFASLSILKKEVIGDGISPMTWQWSYPAEVSKYADECSGGGCPDSKVITIQQPDGSSVNETYGISYGKNEGKLLRSEVVDSAGIVMSSDNYFYSLDPVGQLYIPKVGFSPSKYPDPKAGVLQPMVRNEKNQEGVSYAWSVVKNGAGTYSFDLFSRPVETIESSTLGYSRSEVSEYFDQRTLWVLGLPLRQYTLNASPNGVLPVGAMTSSETEYTALGQPWKIRKFGKLEQALTYHADGTLSTVADGNGRITTLSNWKRGIPQLIRHAATPEAPEGAVQSATVSDYGWITSVTNEAGSVTGYGYDVMGRLASIVHPSDNAVASPSVNGNYYNTIRNFRPLVAADWKPAGVVDGQWRLYEETGNRATVTYMDALWRPILKHEYDAQNVAATLRASKTTYDTSGRVSFQSYPSSNTIPGNDGTRTFYDALDRVTRVEQDSEHGVLATTTQYLAGLRTLITNPKGFSTTTSFMAWDQPIYDFPILSEQPEGKVIQIGRHPQFGWPLVLTQRNAANTLSATRRYVYDGNAQLCKTMDPENGVTVMGYDEAGNPTWQAAGLDGSSATFNSTVDCQHVAAYGAGRTVTRTYDPRNRLTHLTFPNGLGNQVWTYEKDNLPKSVTAYNDAGNAAPVVTTYTYNNRRLLVGETLAQPGWYSWSVGYAYDGYGHLSTQTYPTGLVVDYAPNPLGQPTKAGTYATGAQYHPNGTLKQFTYGNGIVHTMTQNLRQLPERTISSGGVLDYQNYYDANGNVEHIANNLGVGWDPRDRWMQYDQLDRLTAAGSGSFGGDHWHRMTYDALDNLKSWKLAGVKDYADYVYDTQNRLSSIRNTAGATVEGLAYGPQGNLQNKNGQGYEFDFGNRLRAVTGKEAYRYDGLGRRVMNWRWPTTSMPSGSLSFSMYTQSGQVVYEEDYHSSPTTAKENIYLAGSVIATRENKWGVSLEVKYQHTDALGSPVAVTNAFGQVIERMDYEPWGAIIGKPNHNGIGYTGHVMDAATGLTYMQQRYYDQSIGLFLSVDPVTAHEKPGENFNRYWYANNNPYKFNDPDGRVANAVIGAGVGAGLDFGIQVLEIAIGTRTSIDGKSILISAGTGALGVGIAGKIGKLGSVGADAAMSVVSNAAKGNEVTVLGTLADVAGGDLAKGVANKAITASGAHRVAQRQVSRTQRIGNKPGARQAQRQRAQAAGPALQRSVAQRAAQSGVVGSGAASAAVENGRKIAGDEKDRNVRR